MTAPVWVPLAAIVVIHDRQIARHGGTSGLRDRALLEMGCARAMNLAAYTDAWLVDIAAAYAFGLSKAHAFVDCNKRTASYRAHLPATERIRLLHRGRRKGADDRESRGRRCQRSGIRQVAVGGPPPALNIR